MPFSSILQVYRDLIPYRNRWLIIVILAFMFISASLETLSIGAVFPLISLLVDPSGVADKNEFIEKMFTYGRNIFGKNLIVIFAVGVIFLFITKNICLYLLTVFQNNFCFRNMTHAQTELYTRYLKAPYILHFSTNSANLIRNVTIEIGALFNNIMRCILAITVDVIMIGVVSLLLLFVTPWITLTAFIGFSLIHYLFSRLLKNELNKLGLVRQKTISAMIQWIHEGMGGLREIKVLGREEHFARKLRATSRDFTWAESRFASLGQVPRLFFEVLAVTGMLSFVIFLSQIDHSKKDIIPMLAMFSLAAVRLAPAFNRIMGNWTSLRYNKPSVEVINQELKRLSRGEKGKNPSSVIEAPTQKLGLHLEKISFQYPGSDHCALDNVQLSIAPNEVIGIIGESGAGKTTLINIVMGLIDPTSGTIFVDGVPLDGSTEIKKNLVGYVPQEVFLSDDSIRHNVAYGLEDEEIDEKRVKKSIHLARLDFFSNSLPEGLETLVGERGSRISGGQKQRIGIARAIYSDPRLFVFDEPTSALDNETEKEIATSIEEISAEKMVIIVTHRQGLLSLCDQIYRMTAGRLEKIEERMIA